MTSIKNPRAESAALAKISNDCRHAHGNMTSRDTRKAHPGDTEAGADRRGELPGFAPAGTRHLLVAERIGERRDAIPWARPAAAWLRSALIAAAVAGILLVPAAPAAENAAEGAELERTLALGRAELELARGEGFYLVLDVARGSLDLMHRGAVLRQWTVPSVEIGHPRVLLAHSRPAAGWDLRVWTAASFVPARQVERNVVIAPRPDTADTAAEPPESAVIPPMPEELFPAPDRWRLRFAGGLALEVLTTTARSGLGERLVDGARALGLVSRDEVRIRLRLPADEAGALYRALPEDTALLVRL